MINPLLKNLISKLLANKAGVIDKFMQGLKSNGAQLTIVIDPEKNIMAILKIYSAKEKETEVLYKGETDRAKEEIEILFNKIL